MLLLGLFLLLLFGLSLLHHLFALCIQSLYHGCQYVNVYIFGNGSSCPISVPSLQHRLVLFLKKYPLFIMFRLSFDLFVLNNRNTWLSLPIFSKLWQFFTILSLPHLLEIAIMVREKI